MHVSVYNDFWENSMKYYYFIHRAERELLRVLPNILKELMWGASVQSLIKKYHISRIAGDRYASKHQILDPILIEVLSFLELLHETQHLSYEELSRQVSFVTTEDAFIYASDESIYHKHPDASEFVKIFPGTGSIAFVSMRDNFYHPFFRFVSILSQKWYPIYQRSLSDETLDIATVWPYKDKAYTLSCLHQYAPDMAWPFAIHYYQGNERSTYAAILRHMKYLVWDEVMLKRSFWAAGATMRPLSLKSIHPDTLDRVSETYLRSWGAFSGTITMPLYRIKKEYRIYYTMQDGVIETYGIKERINTLSRREILKKTDFRIYETIPVKWKYRGEKIEHIFCSELQEKIRSMIKNIGYITGILEVIETKEGHLVLMEVNYLGSSLVFPWQDVDNMIKFNKKIHNFLLS